MSEVRANTISNAAGTGPATLTKQSAAKVWAGVEVNGTTTGSFGVSSVTDVGVGAASVNLTSAFNSTNFSVENSVHIAVTTAHSFTSTRSSASGFTHAHYVGGAAADPVRYHGTAHGDLA